MARANLKICLALAAVTAGGCATRVPVRDRGVYVGSQGASSEVVFAGAGVVDRLGIEGPTWEDARRDASLSARQPISLTATSQWPDQRRPSLDRARRLHLRTHSRTILYFGDSGPYSGGAYIGRPYY